SPALAGNVAVDVGGAVVVHTEHSGQVGVGAPFVEAPQGNVHLPVGQRVVELVLPLGKTVGVGARHGVADILRQAHVTGQGINLRLVEVGDGLQIGGAVTVLDEESLIVFHPVRCAHHRIVEAIGVTEFDRLANALFVIGGGDDGEILADRQGLAEGFAGGVFHNQLEVIDAALGAAIDGNLVLPAVAVVGEDAPDRLVAPAIAADGFQHRGNVLHLVLNIQVF